MTQEAVRRIFSGFGRGSCDAAGCEEQFFWNSGEVAVTQKAVGTSFSGFGRGGCDAASCEKQFFGFRERWL